MSSLRSSDPCLPEGTGPETNTLGVNGVSARKSIRALAAVPLLLLAFVVLTCGSTLEPTAVRTLEPVPTAVPAPELFPYTVTDGNGAELTFDEPPLRIVALDTAAVETLFAIGEGHRVVGTHSFATYTAAAADIAKVSDASSVNLEATVDLEPDLVFIFFDRFKADLENAGLRVLYLQSLSDSLTDVTDNIRMWGRIVGEPDAAEAVAADFEARVETLSGLMSGRDEGPTVFLDEGDLWTPGPDTLVAAVFRLLKLRNIAHDITAYSQMSPEVIVDRDPQIVVASYGDTISGNAAFLAPPIRTRPRSGRPPLTRMRSIDLALQRSPALVLEASYARVSFRRTLTRWWGARRGWPASAPCAS